MLLVEEGGEGVTDSGRKRNWVERRKGKVDQRLVFEGSLMPPSLLINQHQHNKQYQIPIRVHQAHPEIRGIPPIHFGTILFKPVPTRTQRDRSMRSSPNYIRQSQI